MQFNKIVLAMVVTMVVLGGSITAGSAAVTVSGHVSAGTSGYTGGNILIGAYDGPDPGAAALLDSTMISNIADAYSLDNLEAGARIYIRAFWDKDGNGLMTPGDCVGVAAPVSVGQGETTAPIIELIMQVTAQKDGPYFAAAAVLAYNSPDGLQTTFFAQVADPNGSLPGSVASLTVTSPGGTTLSLTADDFTAPCTYMHQIQELPVEGEYAFTITDTEGKSAVTYAYFKAEKIIPLPDTTSFQASGDPLAPRLSWAAVPGYLGNVFYRARIFDAGSNIIWSSDFNPNTFADVPPGVLVQGTSCQWRVEAADGYHLYASGNFAVSNKQSLVSENTRPYFLYASAQNRSDNGTISLALEAAVADPDGGLPGSIASLTVTDPVGSQYPLISADFNGASYNHKFPGVTPLTGVYGFTVTDTNGHTSTTYDYLEARDIAVVDQSTLQASGDPLTPFLSWGAPAQMDRPLYFRARINNDAGTSTLWSSGRVSNTMVQVPSGTLQTGVSYKWQVQAEDASNNVHAGNQSRTPLKSLTTDDQRVCFQSAGVSKRHTADGVYTAFSVRLSDPNGTLPGSIASLTVSGPGVQYTFVPEDFTAADHSFSHLIAGPPAPGVYTFSVTDGDALTAVTHDILMPAGDVPLLNENSFLTSGDPPSPTVSWSGISGYPGPLFYTLKIRDSQNNDVYASNRTPTTAQTISPGVLLSGQSYTFRVEAQDHQDGGVYNTRSDSAWLPLTGQPQQYLAFGTYTYLTNILTLNTTDSSFVCEGPEVGHPDIFTVIWQSATEILLREPDGYEMAWTRAGGTSGDIVGTWRMVQGFNSYAIAISADGSYTMLANIAKCSGDGGVDEGPETFSVWTGVSRVMTGAGAVDTKILHFHLWAPTGTVTRVEVSGPGLPPGPGSYTFTEFVTRPYEEVSVDDFSKDIPVAVDPVVGDVYYFTVTRADNSTVNLTQTIGEVGPDAPLVTSPTGHAMADATLGEPLNITWTLPERVTESDIGIQGNVCAGDGSPASIGTVVNVTSGSITLPTSADAAGAYFDVWVHYGDHVFSTTRYEFGSGCVHSEDSIAPSAPTGLTANAVGPNRIDLSWTPSTDNIGVEGYKVYRDGLETGTTAGPAFNDASLAAGTRYCYMVKAYDAAGNLSGPGDEICATTPGPFYAYSYHQQDGYFISSFVEDPDGLFSSVTVSGPGLAGDVSMTYVAGSGRWEIPSLLLGSTLPSEPRTYQFVAVPVAGGDPVTGSVTVSVYVGQFAVDLQPVGNVTNPQPVFSWTGFPQAAYYAVIVGDLAYNWIWGSPIVESDQTSVIYDGPALTPGQTYRYMVISTVNTDGNANSSFAEGQFTFTPILQGDVNNDLFVDTADAILALQVLSGMNPPGISSTGSVNGGGRIGSAEIIYILQVLAGERNP